MGNPSHQIFNGSLNETLVDGVFALHKLAHSCHPPPENRLIQWHSGQDPGSRHAYQKSSDARYLRIKESLHPELLNVPSQNQNLFNPR